MPTNLEDLFGPFKYWSGGLERSCICFGCENSLQELTGNSLTASIYLAGLSSRCSPHSLALSGLVKSLPDCIVIGRLQLVRRYVSPAALSSSFTLLEETTVLQDAEAKQYRIIRTTSQRGMETLSEVGTTRTSFLFDMMSAAQVQLLSSCGVQCDVKPLLFL